MAIKLRLPLVLVRDKVKKHGLKKMIDGYIPSKQDKVVIVDDIFTTGTCIMNMAKIFQRTGIKIIAGCVAVNRGDIAKFKIPIKYLLTAEHLSG